MAHYPSASPAPYKRGPEFKKSRAFEDAAFRAQLFAHAAREALLDIVWSNVEIPRNMKALIQPGLASSSFSRARDAERIHIGADLIPQGAPEGLPSEQARAEYGLCDGFISDKEFEQFGRQHLMRQYGHYLYSDDEMGALGSIARDLGADEKTFGLLETLRVERRMGVAMNEQFDWRDFYPRSQAEQMEPSLRPLFHWVRDGWRSDSGLGEERESVLKNFYERVLMASDSHEVMLLAKEWQEAIFPELQKDAENQQSESSQNPAKDGNPGDGNPGDGKPSDGKPGDGNPGDGNPGDGNPGDGKPGEGKPGEGKPGEGKSAKADGIDADRDPLDIGKGSAKPAPTASGMPSLLEQIVNALKEGAKPGAAPKDSGADGKEGKPSSAASGKPGAALEVGAPTEAEAKSERAGHAFSKSSGGEAAGPPPPGEWNTSPSNVEILEGSRDFFASGLFNAAEGEPVNEAEAAQVARVIEKMFTGKTRSVASDTPSKKMSVRHMARGEVKYLRKEDYSRGKMFIDMVVDCSGSMSGPPMESARSLVAALSDLAVKNMVEGRVIFSSGEGWMACKLPIKRELIARMQAFSGSEGIKAALYDNAYKLRVADAVFVYTDAQITDSSFDKTELAGRKVEPMGLYVGEESAQELMARYFNRYIIRPTLPEMSMAMVQRFLMQKKETVVTQQKKSRLRGG